MDSRYVTLVKGENMKSGTSSEFSESSRDLPEFLARWPRGARAATTRSARLTMASSRRFCFSVRIEEGKVTIIALRGQKSAASHRENPAAGPRKRSEEHTSELQSP